jgi:hypothetical protein
VSVSLLRLVVVAGLLCGAACGGKDKSQGAGGAGGGTSGAGGAPITGCPASTPSSPIACSGSFNCQLGMFCTCHGCCFATYACVNGRFIEQDYNGCIQMPCPDGGAGSTGGAGTTGSAGTGGSGGAAGGSGAPVCTVGADQSCNDNPALSSLHGHCTDAGVCACSDAGTNPDSGRCL